MCKSSIGIVHLHKMVEFKASGTMTGVKPIPFNMEKQRNKRIRDRVFDMYKEFVSEVDPKNVLDLLIQKRVISIEQKQEIMNKVTTKDRCRALLDHLFFCSSDESFIVLREALEDHYHWIVERIDQCETDNETEHNSGAKCNQCRMTKTEQQEHPEDTAHVKLQFDVEERLKKELESLKSNFEIGRKNLEQKLEESRRDIAKIKEQYEESRKETAEMKDQYENNKKDIAKMKEQYEESRKETVEMKEQYRILKESFHNSLLRERNLKKELDEIKKEIDEIESWVKQEIGDKRILRNAQEALNTTVKSSKPQQTPLASSSESTKEFNNCTIVITNFEVAIIMSLNRPEYVTALAPLPNKFQSGTVAATAAVYRNSIFACGLGNDNKEIWRLDAASFKWSKCASLVQGRQRHSVAFVDHVLYICGGVDGLEVLDDVETYNPYDDMCSKVGKLAYAVYSSGNCVPVKASLYIFGGYDAHGKNVSNVQVYDTKLNACTLLRTQMPRRCDRLCGELWENSVILLGKHVCLIYDIDTETWKVINKFKFENVYSGVIVNDGKLFVIGCGANKDDVRSIPVANILQDELIAWRHYAKLPNNFCENAFIVGKIVYP